MLKGHKSGCRCVGCSVQTRARGAEALRAARGSRRQAQRNPLTRAETAAVLQRSKSEWKSARKFGEAPTTQSYFMGRQDAFRFIAREFGLAARGGRGMKALMKAAPAKYAVRQNPPRGVRVVGRIPGRLLEVRYNRSGSGTRHPGLYKHNFKAGVQAFALSDGSILLRGPRPVWVKQ